MEARAGTEADAEAETRGTLLVLSGSYLVRFPYNRGYLPMDGTALSELGLISISSQENAP